MGWRLREVSRRITGLRAALKEVGSWNDFHLEFEMRLPVLLYHHVGPSRPGTFPGLSVSPERFERHIRWLARRGYTGIHLADWLHWCREGKGLPDKPVLLTFDDGFADLVEYALPALRRQGFGAVVFVVTGQPGGTNTWDEARGSGTHRLMTAEQIRYWATQGIDFGAHSRTHADLTTLTSEGLEEEVLGSRNDLTSLLGSRAVSFAYPYGFYNQGVLDCVRGAFDCAFIADDSIGGMNYLDTDTHLLQRTMVQRGESALGVECRARWGRNPFQDLRFKLRLRTRLKGAARFVFGSSR